MGDVEARYDVLCAGLRHAAELAATGVIRGYELMDAYRRALAQYRARYGGEWEAPGMPTEE